ncbi:Ken-052, partial [Symbiodinium sp. CCMP2456]
THASSKGKRRTSKGTLDTHSFAEGLLFRGSLEQKLQPPPKELFDALKGANAEAVPPATPVQALDLAWPERSDDIAICRGLKGGSDQLPKMGKILASAEARVQCLQKFANHEARLDELQAIEMFAWALLRFPDAPRGLQRGLLKTIREEQSHCRLYLDRIAALAPGSAPLGPAPLSGYLWRSLESVNSAPEPLLAFLCGIGLTFEAANLDHSLRYRDIFRQAGDEDSAAVLQRVHDEVELLCSGLRLEREEFLVRSLQAQDRPSKRAAEFEMFEPGRSKKEQLDFKLACAEDGAAELLWPCCFAGSASRRCGVQLFPCTRAVPASPS